jgi:predicted nucleic acid-binding protein
MRPAPSAQVLAWARAQGASEISTTAICEAELLFGIAILPASQRRDKLERALATVMMIVLGGRVLPFDRAAARAFANLAAARRRTGRPAMEADMLIASIAKTRNADAIATRNVADFDGCGVPLINPWEKA